MFKNRQITVKLDKKEKDQTSDNIKDPHVFERSVDIVAHKLEGLGAKMFLGVCVYILLDTHRQVAVEKAKHQ